MSKEFLGLGPASKPFIYLDDFIQSPNWENLHNELSYGLALATWHKRFVSSGVHNNWAEQEVTTYIKNYENYLSVSQRELYEKLNTTDQRIKFINCLLAIPHPFWLVYIRDNKRIERTGIENKSIAGDSHWTEDSKHFPQLVNFVQSLPFAGIGRVIVFMTEANNQTVPHYDAGSIEQRNSKPNDDFIWFTTSGSSKKIFVMNGSTKEKVYAEDGKKFIWWNEMDYHGTDPCPGFTFSVRVDGKFLPEIKNTLFNQE